MEPKLVPQGPEVIKDERAIKEVVSKVKSQGLFDQFRKECIADVDTKPAYHNLLQRVESYVEHFLQEQKWSSIKNKNQLRETLRRQLNNSGMMHNGVERIIEQVVNPKILLGIKPKIDEAVCDHLGIDLKARQEEQQRKKQEQQRLFLQQQQQLHQQNLQSKINQKAPPGDGFDPAKKQPPFGNMGPWGPGMANFPTPSVHGIGNPMPGMPGNPQAMGNFPGIMQPFSMMGGWPPGFNPAMHPMIPGQPMIPAFPGAGIPPTVPGVTPFNANISPIAGSVPASTPAPVIPDLSKPPPGLPNTLTSSAASTRSPVVPPGTSSVAPAPPGSVPPPPGTVPVVPPASSSLVPPGTSPTVPTRAVPATPTIPALISHTLAKVSEDKLTPEKIAVFKTAAAFITKTVNNAQSTPGADLATIFSPRVLAEAMMEESGKPLTKHELRAARRKERMKEIEKLKAERDSGALGVRESMKMEDKEDPLPPAHNLMDVFQGAEDVSDDEEALDMLLDVDETEDKNKTGIILSDESDKEGAEQPPTSQPGKRYNFAWDVDINPEELSDVTVSSIHTSDISSYEEDLSSSGSDSEAEKNKQSEKKVQESSVQDNRETAKETEVSSTNDEITIKSQEETEEEVKDNTASANKEDDALVEKPNEDVSASAPDSTSSPALPIIKETTKPQEPLQPVKPRKLLALSSHYSDSDDDETREERKSRIAKEKEERYLKRQQRRAELEAKRKEREEEKARMKEERKKQKELAAETDPTDISGVTSALSETAIVEDRPMGTPAAEQESTSKSTPRKRKNKAELKEQLLQQKVLEKKAALRRRRTRNRRYASDEFTSIFSERKTLNQGYSDDVINSEDLVTFDGAVEVVELTVDQECVVETVNEVIETTEDQVHTGQESQSTELVLQCPSPYSDISDRSMSDKSIASKADNVSVDKVSSEDELDEDFENAEAIEEVTLKVKEEEATSSQLALEAEESCLQQDGSNSLASEPVSPKSRVSTQSKSVMSQDEFETNSSITDEKSSLKNTGTSHLDEDKESRISLDGGMPSPVTLVDIESSASAKQDNVDTLNSDDKVASPKDIMADLELEPVSDEDSSLGALSEHEKEPEREEEEGEEKDSEGEMKSPAQSSGNKRTPPQRDNGTVEDENASDEGEIKSDSEEEVMKNSPPQAAQQEEDVPRQLARKPIEFVDFGEAEKRARESRVFYSESERRRHLNATSANYRGTYTWQNPGTSSSTNSYPSSSGRYVLDPSSPARSKSPAAAFDAESEASSHSRSSVRVRDDVPPPYPIEGVSRKHKSSTVSNQGSSGHYNPVSPPSPVSSSSSSSRSRHSRSRSKSRSRSHFSSRSSSSDSYSSGSQSSARKKKMSRKKRKKKRRSARGKSKDGTPSVRSHSPSSRISFTDHPSPPHRVSEPPPQPVASGTDPHAKQGHLSSGNESISSDELPYFPDEEAEKSGNPSKIKHRNLSGQSSSSNNTSSTPSKPPDSPGKASISSSELIYSPSRKRVLSEDSDASSSAEQKSDRPKPKRRRKSSSKPSESSDEDFMSPRVESNVVYSPHRPSSPTVYQLLPDDMSGFQPPLPQESPDHPPPPCNEPPPLPPLPPEEDGVSGSPHTPPPLPPSPPPDEVEEGECPSSPEFEEHLPQRQAETSHQALTFHLSHDTSRETNAKSMSKISHSHHEEENIALAERKVTSEDFPVAQSTATVAPNVCSFQTEISAVPDLKEACQTNSPVRPLTSEKEDKSSELPCDSNEREDTCKNNNHTIHLSNEEIDASNSLDKVKPILVGGDENISSEVTASEVHTSTVSEMQMIAEKDSLDIDVADNLCTGVEVGDAEGSNNLAGSIGLKRRAEDCDSSPPSKRQKESGDEN